MNHFYSLLKSFLVVAFLTFYGLMQMSCRYYSETSLEDSLLLVTEHLSVVYDLNKPDQKHYLPYALTEVSGLACLDSNRLLCVEDERGKVYEYDLSKKGVVRVTKFSGKGDFEGIALNKGTTYVVESNGDIYAFDYDSKEPIKVKKFENALGVDNNTEGLAFDALSDGLLIACKGKGNIKDNEVKGKAIYRYDLKDEKLDKEPFFSIKLKSLSKFLEENTGIKPKDKDIAFKPSGIAFNPVDNLIYLLAYSGKLLIVINRKGQIVGTYPLDKKIFKQPEGICFDVNGTMFIASEGQGAKGYILSFNANFK